MSLLSLMLYWHVLSLNGTSWKERSTSSIAPLLSVNFLQMLCPSSLSPAYPGFADFPSTPSRVDLCVPSTLGAVCNYWREIAWSTPSHTDAQCDTTKWTLLACGRSSSCTDDHASILESIRLYHSYYKSGSECWLCWGQIIMSWAGLLFDVIQLAPL